MEKKERRRSVKFSDLPDVFRAASSFESAQENPEFAGAAGDAEASLGDAPVVNEPIPIDEIQTDDVSDLPSHGTHNHTTNLVNRLALHFPSIRRAYTVILRAFLAHSRAISPSAAAVPAGSPNGAGAISLDLATPMPGSELAAAAAPLIPAQLGVEAASLFDASLTAAEKVEFKDFLFALVTRLYLPNPAPCSAAAACDNADDDDVAAIVSNPSESVAMATYAAVRRGIVAVAWAFESISQQKPEGGFITDSPEKKAKNPEAATSLSDATTKMGVEQFKAALFGTVTSQETVELLDKRFGELDLDKSGQVDFSEFAVGLMKWVGLDDDEEEDEHNGSKAE